jgi:ribosomal protein S6
MKKETIPAIEAKESDATEEAAHYECAFHILPTIADEEVPGVVESLKALITRGGGTTTDEEVSERYDLAYEIATQVDGMNRRFNAAHFGWVRFMLVPTALPSVVEEMKQKPEILRHLVIRLTKEEAEKPFSVFETRRAKDREQDQTNTEELARKREARGEVEGEVSEELLNESLEKLTAE